MSASFECNPRCGCRPHVAHKATEVRPAYSPPRPANLVVTSAAFPITQTFFGSDSLSVAAHRYRAICPLSNRREFDLMKIEFQKLVDSGTVRKRTDKCRCDRNRKLIRFSTRAPRAENSYVIAESRPARRPMRKVSSECGVNRTFFGLASEGPFTPNIVHAYRTAICFSFH